MRPTAKTVKIERIEYHRNGVGGEGFHVVTFTDYEAWEDGLWHERPPRPMVAVVFEGEGRVAVFDRVLLGQGEIGFGKNSWRGDRYEPILRRAIRQAEDEADRTADEGKA